jgi:hypothetical protein
MRVHRRLSVVRRTVEYPSPAGGVDGGSDQCSEAGSLVIAKRVAFDVPRVQSRRKHARQRSLSAASAADHDDSLWDWPSGYRTCRHAHDGTARVAGCLRPCWQCWPIRHETTVRRPEHGCRTVVLLAYELPSAGRDRAAGKAIGR